MYKTHLKDPSGRRQEAAGTLEEFIRHVSFLQNFWEIYK
jgi:hypothetical protein